MTRSRCATLMLLLVATVALHADAPGVYAITGGTVHTVTGAEIANGTVIIRDGLIESAGSGVAVPPDAAVIDATNQHVYPGLIDAQTSLGFPPPAPPPRRRRDQPRPEQPPVPPPETSPAYEAVRNVKLSDDDLDSKRATGVTTIVAAPYFGIFNGQSVILNLGNGTMESRVIRTPAAMQVSFNTRPAW